MKLKVALIFFFSLVFAPILFKNAIAAPVDTLTGAYFPWLTYKWGYTVGVPVKNALLSDVFDSFFIWKHQGMQQFFSGHIPAWTANEFLGSPLLAAFHTALLHPANILFLLPIPWGWNLYIMGSTIAAFISMYIFLRSYRFARVPCAIGSLMFCLGGPMMTWLEFGTAVWAMAMVPLLLWSIRTSRHHLIPALITCLILSGNVQIITYAALLIPVYAMCSTSINKTIKIGILCLLGVALSAIQLLPTAAYYPLTIRSTEKYSSTFNYGLQSANQLIRFITPDIFGHPATANYTNNFSYHEYTGYFTSIGLALVVLSLINVVTRRQTHQVFFITLFAISIFLSLDTPLSHWLFSLPIPLLTYSSASRVFFLSVFAGSFLATQQLASLSSSKKKLGLIILCAAVIVTIQLLQFREPQLSIGLKNSLIPIGSLSILLVSTCLPKRIRPWLILAVVGCDLFRFTHKYTPLPPARLTYPSTQAIAFLQTHQEYAFVSLSENTLPPNTWAWYGLRSFAGYNPLHLESYNRFAQVANSQGYANTPSRYVKITQPNVPLLRAANVGYYVVAQEQVNQFPQLNNLSPVFTGEGLVIYFDAQSRPRRYLLAQSRTIPASDLPQAIQKYATNQVPDVTTHQLSAGVQVGVIAQAYAPGWIATLGHQNLTTFPVDGALLGIELPAGKSLADVQLTYLPPGLLEGASITLIGVVLYGLYLRGLSSKFGQKKV